MKKLFLLGIMCFVALAMNAQSFVDLGLPSGTKWKTQNQTGLYTFDQAVSKFGNRLPTKEQWDELQIECTWEWTGAGYLVTGPNGKSIVMSAEGSRFCDDYDVEGMGRRGNYWSSTPDDSSYSWYLVFNDHDLAVISADGKRCYGFSVRLVQNQ